MADRPNSVLREDTNRFLVVSYAKYHEGAVRFFGKECVRIFEVDLVVSQDVQHVDQSAGLVLDLHCNDFGDGADITLIFEDLDRVEWVVHNDADDAEIFTLRQGESPQVNVALLQDLGKLRQCAGSVLQKYGNLFDCHLLLLFSPFRGFVVVMLF